MLLLEIRIHTLKYGTRSTHFNIINRILLGSDRLIFHCAAASVVNNSKTLLSQLSPNMYCIVVLTLRAVGLPQQHGAAWRWLITDGNRKHVHNFFYKFLEFSIKYIYVYHNISSYIVSHISNKNIRLNIRLVSYRAKTLLNELTHYLGDSSSNKYS